MEVPDKKFIFSCRDLHDNALPILLLKLIPERTPARPASTRARLRSELDDEHAAVVRVQMGVEVVPFSKPQRNIILSVSQSSTRDEKERGRKGRTSPSTPRSQA